jgi:CelD/BcsL family acetyltransferase involved in cellulose biosynthesis
MKPAPSVLPPKPPLRWRTHRLERSLGEHAAAWARLHERLPLQHPMLDARYVDTLLKHYGDGGEHLCVLEGNDGHEAMAILRRSGPFTWASFMPAQTQVGPHLLRSIDQAAGLARALPGWVAAVELLCVDPAITANPEPGAGMPECLPQALTVNVDIDGDFDQYWSKRPAKLRDRIRKLERNIPSDLGAPRLVNCTGTSVREAVRRYAALECAGWKAQAGTALTPGGAQEAFYVELLERFSDTGECHVLELWFGERLVASRLLLARSGCLAILKTTFDEGFRRHGPGRLLLARLIQFAHTQRDIQRVEFCTNANHDQMYWVTGQRQVCHWTLYRNTSVSGAHRLLRSVLRAWRRNRSTDAFPSLENPENDAQTVTVYRSFTELPRGASQLLDEQAGADFGRTAEWFAQVETRVFGGFAGTPETTPSPPEATVCYLVLSSDGAVTAVVPLVQRSIRGRAFVSSLTSMYTALYAPAIEPWIGPVDLLPLVRALREEIKSLTSIAISPIDLTAPSIRTLHAALVLDGFAVFRYFCFANWTLTSPPAWPDYLAARPGALRTSIQRSSRRLAGMGAKTEIFSRPEDAERALMAFQHVYARSWKVPEPFPEFIPGLVDLCARKGWLRMGVVWLGEKPIAAQLWIVANGRAAIFKLAYDEAYRRLGAGTALTAHLMKNAIEHERVYEVDYLIGDDAYKRDWMNQRKERWGLVAFNPRTLGGAVGALGEATGRAVKPWLRSLPAWRDGVSVRSEKP